jgi:hypothetical protein
VPSITADITNPRLMYAKGVLFLIAGTMAGGLLIAEAPSLRIALLLALTVWCFARAYYFAFYVIERYIDREFRFAGLTSVAQYLWRRRT